MEATERLIHLKEHTAKIADVMDFFDSLPAVPLETMIGRWKGSGLPTGHPMDGLLEKFGWYGKEFKGLEEVQPLLFEADDGDIFPVNPSLVPMNLVLDHINIAQSEIAAQAFKLLGKATKTEKPQARLRRIEHRGVITTCMIYDSLPIIDIFRKIDEDTVLGIMDLRNNAPSFCFILTRDKSSDLEHPGH